MSVAAQNMHNFSTVPKGLENEGRNHWSFCSQGDLDCLDLDMKIPKGLSTCLSDDLVDHCQLAEYTIESHEFPFLATFDYCRQEFDDSWFVSDSLSGGKTPISEDGHADNSSEGEEGYPCEEDCFDACSSLYPAQSASGHNKEGVNKSQVAIRSQDSAHDFADAPWRAFLSSCTPAARLNAKTSDESVHTDDSIEGEHDFNSSNLHSQQERQTKRRKGATRSKNHNKHNVAILLNWYMANLHCPFPREEVKVDLAKITSMTPAQVTTWFVNQRKRSPYRKLASMPWQSANNRSSIRIHSARHLPA